ncbi:MAG: YfiR family protein [Candidatus Acidiferrales bacterium]
MIPPRSGSSFLILSVTLGVLLFGVANPVLAQSKADEYRLKAAFLFHFTQLVDWPPDAFGNDSDPVTLCTVGEDPFHGDLDAAVVGKTMGARPLRVRHFKQPEDIQGCQLLFVGNRDSARTSALLAGLKDSPVLTVGETDDFVKEGGMIGFFIENDKIRFDINLQSAEHAKLRISSRLLLLARKVIGNQK